MDSYKCKICDKSTFYHENRDSYFCALCNTWNEDECSDDDCCFCATGENTPLKDAVHEIIIDAYREFGFGTLGELIEFYFELERQ